MTALHSAAYGGHRDCVEVLLDKGADVMAKNKVSGECAVCVTRWCVVWAIHHMESVDLRSDHHQPHLTPLNTRPPSFPPSPRPPSLLCPVVIQGGWMALHWAASGGHRDCVEVLLDKGADVMAKNKVSGECGGEVMEW